MSKAMFEKYQNENWERMTREKKTQAEKKLNTVVRVTGSYFEFKGHSDNCEKLGIQ